MTNKLEQINKWTLMVFSKILQHFFLDVFVGSSIKIALVSGAELMQLVYVFFFLHNSTTSHRNSHVVVSRSDCRNCWIHRVFCSICILLLQLNIWDTSKNINNNNWTQENCWPWYFWRITHLRQAVLVSKLLNIKN